MSSVLTLNVLECQMFGFFLFNYILNLCSVDLEAFMKSLNLGPKPEKDHEHEHENEHDHHDHEHTDHDHSGGRRRKRGSHEHHEGQERNATWEQVHISTMHRESYILTKITY